MYIQSYVLPSGGDLRKQHPGLASVMAAAKEGEYDAARNDDELDVTNGKCVKDDVKVEQETGITQVEGQSVVGRDKESFRNFPGFVDMSSPGSSASLVKMDSKYSPGRNVT